MSLELQKKFVEKERQHNAKLEKMMGFKNKEIEELKLERDFLLKVNLLANSVSIYAV